MCNLLKIILIIILNILCSDSAKILAIYPIPSVSHQIYFRSLTTELLRRGHDLTVVTTDPAFTDKTAPKNIREIDIHDMSYGIWQTFLQIPLGESNYVNLQMRAAFDTACKVFENIFKIDAVKNIIGNKDDTFDVLLYDGLFLACIVFSYIYKIPAIAVNSLGGMPGNYESIGAVVNEAYYPSNLSPDTARTQVERFKEVFKYCYYQYDVQWYIEKIQSEAVKNALGAHMPDIRDLKGNINMMFVNLYPAWDSHRPIPISLKYMGGLHSVAEKPLPDNIKSYLDSSKNGVIYMSLGTNVNCSRLPQEKIQIFIKVFSQLPYDVLWKWESGALPNKPENVRVFQWLPQSDVLKHPKIKLFITQGGLQSTAEAITAGVPLLGIPMLGDQWFNTAQYVRYHLGVRLNFDTITEESLWNAVHYVIGNNSYNTNIVSHRSLMHDQPQKALDHATWWIEYIIRHGGSHLQAPAADISWAEYLELELVVITMFSIGTAVVSLCFVLKFMIGTIVDGKKRLK